MGIPRTSFESLGLGDGKHCGISVGDTPGNPRTSLQSSRLGDGIKDCPVGHLLSPQDYIGDREDCGVSMLCGGHTGNPRECPQSSGLGDRERHWESSGSLHASRDA